MIGLNVFLDSLMDVWNSHLCLVDLHSLNFQDIYNEVFVSSLMDFHRLYS